MIHEIVKKQFLIALCAILGNKVTTIQAEENILKKVLKSSFILQFDTPTTKVVNPGDVAPESTKLAFLIRCLRNMNITKSEMRTLDKQHATTLREIGRPAGSI